jgi:uncharacterized protein YjiK
MFLTALRSARWYRWLLGFLLLVGAVLAIAWHWDDRALFWLRQQQATPSSQAASIWLPGYHAVIEGKSLDGLAKGETSGLTYNPATDTLFTVTGRNPELVELSLAGDVLRRITLTGFSNPEGVEVIDGGRLAIIDERIRTLTAVSLTDETTSLDSSDYPSFDLGFADAGNKGFEGIAWDALNQRVLLGKERGPLGLFSLAIPDLDGYTSQEPVEALPAGNLFVRDISSLSHDARTGHMLVLSDESRLLLEVDAQGEPVSFISLIGGLNGLHSSIKQAEGVTMDAAGNIYIVGEPNLLYVFSKDQPVVLPKTAVKVGLSTD